MTLPIRKHRKKLGLTQKALASTLDVSVTTLLNWEAGKVSPRGKNLAKLEKFLGGKASAAAGASKQTVLKRKSQIGGRKSKAGKQKKAATKKKLGRPKKKARRVKKVSSTPKKAVARPGAPQKRGRPKGSKSATTDTLAVRLEGVAKDLGFGSTEDMVETILRKHRIGRLDL